MTALDPAQAARRFPNDPDLLAHAGLRAALMKIDREDVDVLVAVLLAQEVFKALSGAVLDKVGSVGYFTPFQMSPAVVATFTNTVTPDQARGAAFECARMFEEAGFTVERNEKGHPVWRIS